MTRDKDNISNMILWISIRVFMNVLLLFVLVEVFVTSYYFSYRLFADHPYKAASTEMTDITIEPGSSLGEIASVLEEKEVVEGKYLFLARVYLGKYNTRIMAGTYTLSPGMSPDEICRKICGIQSEDAS